jgi:hypothetical protein
MGFTSAAVMLCAAALSSDAATPQQGTTVRLTLERLVDPASRIEIQGRLVRPALLAHIRFDTLQQLFAYVDTEAGRWTFGSGAERDAFATGLMRRGVESRVISMDTELPLEVILTHTRAELARAATEISTGDGSFVFNGRHWQLTKAAYRDAFLRVRDRWSTSLNCWSASSSIPGRVLSNWYLIDEGIDLYGATYDSTEHFWQAVKYHPDVTSADLRQLLHTAAAIDWRPWMARLRTDQKFYFANAYAVEFLERNLSKERLAWFDAELARVTRPDERARTAQQRLGGAVGSPPRFTALDEKVLWGDLADVFHLVMSFAHDDGPAGSDIASFRKALASAPFDSVYLAGYAGGKMPFLSPQFQALMLEIWKVKFLAIPRLNEVIRSTRGVRLDHFLDDGDSPDIPIPVYVGYLNRIRDLALEGKR